MRTETPPLTRPLRLAALVLACWSTTPVAGNAAETSPRITGFVDEELAYTTADPTHWSRAVTRLQLSTEGKVGEGLKWKIGGRADVDPAIDNSNFYVDRVRRDQRADFFWRETYLDFAAGDWAFRLGAQNIVWGEVAGLFFADVVSARDLREFLLPDFDIIRKPQWAARAEYFAGDAHLELIWIPAPSFDDIGKPGSDFYSIKLPSPATDADVAPFRDPTRPERKFANSNFGVRAGTLVQGWDLAAFYYRSFATSPTFYRVAVPAGFVFEPRHDRIWQVGATATKDLGSFVLRGEAVYASGQNFPAVDPAAPNGVVARKTLDWIASLERPFEGIDGRINVQLFKRHYLGGSADAVALNSGGVGGSVLVSAKISPQWEPSLQWIQATGGAGAMIRPRLTWYPARNVSAALGADIFNGDADGFFGRYANRDRAYLDVRYSF